MKNLRSDVESKGVIKIKKFDELEKEMQHLQKKRNLLRLRKEALLKVFEFNDYIKSVNEKSLMKPIVPFILYDGTATFELTAFNAELDNNEIERITTKIIKLNKELHLLDEKRSQKW